MADINSVDDFLATVNQDALQWYSVLHPPAAPAPATVAVNSGGLFAQSGSLDIGVTVALVVAVLAVILVLKK